MTNMSNINFIAKDFLTVGKHFINNILPKTADNW